MPVGEGPSGGIGHVCRTRGDESPDPVNGFGGQRGMAHHVEFVGDGEECEVREVGAVYGDHLAGEAVGSGSGVAPRWG